MTAIAEGAAVADAILQGIITDLQFFVGTEHEDACRTTLEHELRKHAYLL